MMLRVGTWARADVLPAVTLALGISSAAQGGIIYDNGGPDQTWGTQMSEFQVADDFQIGASADINNIRFWSIQSAGADYTGSIYWAIYRDALGLPGTLVQGGLTVAIAETATGSSTGFGYAEYLFDIPVAFTLAAGNYWLGLHNGPLTNTSAAEMLWSTTANPGGTDGLYLDQGVWIASGNDQAFRLDGEPTGAPEPGTLALFGVGLAAAFRRRVHGKYATTA
jgi:hypothetical protein